MRRDDTIQDVVIDGMGYRLQSLEEFSVWLRHPWGGLKGITLRHPQQTRARLEQESNETLLQEPLNGHKEAVRACEGHL